MKNQNGFTLLEVILSLSLMTMLTLGVSTLMRGSFDIREAMKQTDKISHSSSALMSRLARDLSLAYIIQENDIARFGDVSKRKVKTLYETSTSSEGDVLRFTTLSHVALVRNAAESDSSFVVYKMGEDKETGRKTLMRGEFPRIPDDFKQDPPMFVIARDVKSFKVWSWRGDEWSQPPWDSSSREMRTFIPKMVKVEIEFFQIPFNPDSRSSRTLSTEDEPSVKVQTIVNIAQSFGFPEPRASTGSVRWDRL